ncbi:MAG: PIN domain-containing protein [Micrococcales bacterium]|nr:PIN domain-containing protein [Micrococcales bacterium]
MIFLDTDVVAAYTERGHIHANRALELLATNEVLAIHPLALAQCAVDAVDKGDELRLHMLMERIGVTVWSPDPRHSRRVEHLRAITSVSLLEGCVLDAAERENATLATFNARLAQLARVRACPVLTLAADARPAAN